MERAEGIKWNTCLTSRWFIYLYLLILQLAFPFSWALHSSWESYDGFCHQSKYFFRRYWIAMDIKIVAVLISSVLFLKLNNWSILIYRINYLVAGYGILEYISGSSSVAHILETLVFLHRFFKGQKLRNTDWGCVSFHHYVISDRMNSFISFQYCLADIPSRLIWPNVCFCLDWNFWNFTRSLKMMKRCDFGSFWKDSLTVWLNFNSEIHILEFLRDCFLAIFSAFFYMRQRCFHPC